MLSMMFILGLLAGNIFTVIIVLMLEIIILEKGE